MLLYEKDDSDWYLVKLGDELGLAPSNYVNEVGRFWDPDTLRRGR